MDTQEPVTKAPSATLQPVGEDRSETLDVIRGVAVLGIFAMNIATFAMPFAAYSNPTLMFPYEGLNRITYWVVHSLFEVKMMSIFSMLFGAGAVLYSEKAATRFDARRVRSLWLRRMGWLWLLGMIHAYLIWEGDILVSYALTGLLVVWWLRRLPVWALFGASAGFLLISLFLSLVGGLNTFASLHPDIAQETLRIPAEAVTQMKQQADLSWIAPSPESLAEQTDALRGGWLEVFHHRVETAWVIQTFAFGFFIFWRGASMMLLGMALYKLGALTGRWTQRSYACLAVGGYLLGLPLVVGGIAYNTAQHFDPGWHQLVGMQFNLIGSVGVALGHVGLIGLVVRAGVLGAVRRRLAAVGRMALSCYLSESVLAGLIFYGYGLGFAGRLDRFEQQLVVLGVWALLLIAAPLWLARFRFGPAEWLWRSLTYWRPQPMRRTATLD